LRGWPFETVILRAAEDGAGGGGGGDASNALVEIKSLHAEIQGNPEHPYNTPGRPGYMSSQEHMAGLYARAYPEDGPGASGAGRDSAGDGGGTARQSGGGETPAGAGAARDELARFEAEIQGDPEHPYHHRGRPGHKAAHERMMELLGEVYPETDEAADLEQVATEIVTDQEVFEPIARQARLPELAEGQEAPLITHTDLAGYMASLGLTRADGADIASEISRYTNTNVPIEEAPAGEWLPPSTHKALEKFWGPAVIEKAEAAAFALLNIDEDGRFAKFLIDTRLADSPRMIKIFAEAAERNGW
jgi:hypothetical protein